ncbi:unnamed protein product [Ixodes hexagonus]
MAGTFFSLFAVALLQASRCSSACPPYPELNPALGKYQSAGQCFPLEGTWYSIYRNYEFDPLFGGTAKCGKFTSLGPAKNGSYPLLARYADHTRAQGRRPSRRNRTRVLAGWTFFSLFAVALIQASRCSSASPPYPELNPALGKYQSSGQVRLP